MRCVGPDAQQCVKGISGCTACSAGTT
jgi:hypothetical protein